MFVEFSGQRIPLEVGQLYLVGKEINASSNRIDKYCINLEDKNDVDQKHCIIEVGHNEDVFIFDLFSTQGTMLNNKPLKSLDKVRLKNSDIVKVGVQVIKFFQEQQEAPHDNSDFLEVNKNVSDIIISSPEFTSQRVNRTKRLNNNNCIVSAAPPIISSVTSKTSLVETEVNASRNSLNNTSSSVNNRRSDSFDIPETQNCRPRTSLNNSDISVAESIPEANASKIKFNFGNLDDDDDDDEFFIPETQEVMPVTCSQRLHRLSDGRKPQEQTIVEGKTTNMEAENSKYELEVSQFRICTQDYNEGFGEETGILHSQIIPIIKHNTVFLNATSTSLKNNSKNQSKLDSEDKDISAIKWSTSKGDEKTTYLRADCSTPDILNFKDLEPNKQQNIVEAKSKEPNVLEEDQEDLLCTQIFSWKSIKTAERETISDYDNPCLGKENEEVLTLSDKENRCPVNLEAITEFPPTQLFNTNEAPTTKSTSSNSSHINIISNQKMYNFTAPILPPVENNNNTKSVLNLDPDVDDDILTQAFLLPPKPASNSINTSNKSVSIKCFNSTLLDDRLVDKNPVLLFAEMERTPRNKTAFETADAFKMPDKDTSIIKKTSSNVSVNSETDLDLLMCTPQFIKEHLHMAKNDDLKKNILAVKNKDLFGDDTDEDETNDGQSDLVKLINNPKDSKDFDKLLRHLKNNEKHSNVNEKQKAAKEAGKEYKFNISFERELEAQRVESSTYKSSTVSRDERHMARDRERELAEYREQKKPKTSSKHIERENQQKKARQTAHENTEVDGKDNHPKGERTKRNQKIALIDKAEVVKDLETKSVKESKKNKSVKNEKSNSENTKGARETRADKKKGEFETTKNEGKNRESKSEKTRKNSTTENSKKVKESRASKSTENLESKLSEKNKVTKGHKKSEKEIKNSGKSEEPETQIPTRRVTRSKSIYEDKPTSKEVLVKQKTKSTQDEKKDRISSISTKPVVRIVRCGLSSKNNETQDSTTSNSSLQKSGHNKSKSETPKSHNTSSNESVSKTLTERKREAEPTSPIIEHKRLRSTHSQDSISLSHSSSNIYISMTMVDPESFKELVKNSNGIWSIAKNPTESELLVMDKAFRTFKFLLAMARGIPIVTSQYLRKINEVQSVKKVCVTDYLFSDAEFEKKHKFSLIKSLQIAKKQKIFKGYEFLMTPNILPNPSEIKAIIEASGGQVYSKSFPKPKEGQQIYLVSSSEDKKDWHKYRRLNKNIIIISTEAIMSTVMRQTCARMSSYMLT